MSCNGSCSDCKSKNSCSSPEEKKEIKVKKVIAVMSGKGGVGKSFVTGLAASMVQRMGYKVGILDADITGPSIPKLFGIKSKVFGSDGVMYPCISQTGIDIMSLNLLLENETDPVLWKGPMIVGAINQFYNETDWNYVDYLFIDMPPGTGDVAINVLQKLDVAGVIMVTSPQELVNMIVQKAVNMLPSLNVKLLGTVVNMAYFICPNCNEKHYIYGKANNEDNNSTDAINRIELPISSNYASICDKGEIESIEINGFAEFMKNILKIVPLDIEEKFED